jgi:GNAT superfamily N-acetyltransferase
MEANEWSFCSLWTEKVDTRCGKALLNEKLGDDYFFNRAAVEGCPKGAEMQVAKAFWDRGMDCYLYFRSPSTLPAIDTMHVLKSARITGAKHEVVQVDLDGLPVWIDVFTGSFGVPGWRGEVERIMAVNFKNLALLLSYVEGTPAGCAALYRTGGLTGLYCLGTLSRFRGRGIAKSMFGFAQKMSEGDGTRLFLQTLGSEGLFELYAKSGFVLSHTKQICVLKRPI